MSRSYRAWGVGQLRLVPVDPARLLPPHHAAHLVRDVVRQEVDLSGILAGADGAGQEADPPPYHPAMLAALLLYAYTQEVYASSRISALCEERVDFMAVTALQKPDPRTLREFRERHEKALRRVFVQALELCWRAGVPRLGTAVLQDPPPPSFRMWTAEQRLHAQVEGWLLAARRADAREDRHGRLPGADNLLPAWVVDEQERRERMGRAREELTPQVESLSEWLDERRWPARGILRVLGFLCAAVAILLAAAVLTAPEERWFGCVGSLFWVFVEPVALLAALVLAVGGLLQLFTGKIPVELRPTPGWRGAVGWTAVFALFLAVLTLFLWLNITLG